ncbi:MaoC family dehydratase [Hydrogenophaga sp.]|uniref:MaoC family dehydratase n=1 Tax=Hydrogenophaga sp. TaxID=1904254 RepID=UPI00271A8D99|nr:MaoC family dehydratase [Hydrogenophaga sp.]MDO9435974.1 MaoC family dehydratase [Hydrogenophaga sp.]
MKKSLGSIAELKAFVGTPPVISEPLAIGQDAIDVFADLTNDHQWIHVDPVRAAAESPFKGTVAHGFLTLSMVTAWYAQCFDFPNRKLALNYGFDKIRFTSPVPSESSLVARFQLTRVDDVREHEVRCAWQVDIRVQGAERPAVVAEWLIQMRF